MTFTRSGLAVFATGEVIQSEKCDSHQRDAIWRGFSCLNEILYGEVGVPCICNEGAPYMVKVWVAILGIYVLSRCWRGIGRVFCYFYIKILIQLWWIESF